MAALDDLLTATKNLVTGINNLTQTLLNITGAQTSNNISKPTVVSTKAGRLCNISVVLAGTTAGTIYDSNSTANVTKPIYTILNVDGIVIASIPVVNGILVVPGTGQNVSVSYS